MAELKDYLMNNQEKFINKLHEAEVSDIWNDYCLGSLSAWEMDTLGFYYHQHELANIYSPEFKFINFFSQSEIPVPSEYKEYKGRQFPVFEHKYICGTVLDKNSYKHTVVVLTPDGVVNVKCIAEQYSKYDKQISQLNKETGHKEVIEKSWFKKGTKLVVRGYRSGDQFMARGKQSEGKYPFYRITNIDDLGKIETMRYRADD